jgi:hypothetical protein
MRTVPKKIGLTGLMVIVFSKRGQPKDITAVDLKFQEACKAVGPKRREAVANRRYAPQYNLTKVEVGVLVAKAPSCHSDRQDTTPAAVVPTPPAVRTATAG